MALQKAIALVGVAIQTARGTAKTNPEFIHGVTDGNPISIEISQELAPLTSGKRQGPSVDRTAVVAGFSITTRAFPKSLGVWLYGALGGKAVTGAGPYTHTISPAGTLPYLTVFSKLDTDIKCVQDAIVDSLELSWGADGIVSMTVSGFGTVVNYAATFGGSPVDETYVQPLSANGGTLKYGASGAAVEGPISAGSVKISNNADQVMLAKSVVPDEIFWGRQEYETSLTVVPQNLNDWRTIATGSSSGTAASEGPVYGTYDIKLVEGANSLQVVAGRVGWSAPYPSADPAGGHVEFEMSGLPVLASNGDNAFTATLMNSQATY